MNKDRLVSFNLSDYGRIINDAYKEVLDSEMCAYLEGYHYSMEDWKRFEEESEIFYKLGVIDNGSDTLEELSHFTFMGYFNIYFRDFIDDIEENNLIILIHGKKIIKGFLFKGAFHFWWFDSENNLVNRLEINEDKNQIDIFMDTLTTLIKNSWKIDFIGKDLQYWLLPQNMDYKALFMKMVKLELDVLHIDTSNVDLEKYFDAFMKNDELTTLINPLILTGIIDNIHS